ncbi:non-specific lipid transfer protein GPI-anchored 10 [Cornus florida]|uniref:non-specific lipid transfer protein GPI-anchored 10 n=1 Tax=Cornus florida TaxID=4283 RepID=UPI00289FAFC1|nr:non-specific lipid transfer protein GPI-anchored 10 [Cornus florida]
MPSSKYSFPSIASTFLVLVFLTGLPSTTHSQIPGTSPTDPTITQCGPRLLPLTSCAAFVQGTAPSPAQQCCDNIKQVYSQQPSCLCLLLNNTTLASLPINTTLALQLPTLCNLQIGISTCSGIEGVPLSPSSPSSQVSFGTKNNSTVAASPMVTVAPRPTIMGFGFGHSAAGIRLKMEDYLVVLVAAIAFMFSE